MPEFDRTGPEGKGPGTGRGMGRRRQEKSSQDRSNQSQNQFNQKGDSWIDIIYRVVKMIWKK